MNTPSRVQLYRPIHKALRFKMAQLLIQCGQTNPVEETELLAVMASAEALLNFCEKHIELENHFIHIEVAQRAPHAIKSFDQDHAEHEKALIQLRHHIKQAQHSRRVDDDRFHHFYLLISEFIADNLLHMKQEETTLTAALWQHFSDDELLAIEAKIKQSLPFDDMIQVLATMSQAMHHGERAGMLLAVQQQAPREFIDKILKILSTTLDKVSWAKLTTVLGQAI